MSDREIEQEIQAKGLTAPRSRVPWLASQTDMLSEDWQIV